MPLFTGIDILEISRLREAVERHGETFLRRIYTPAERELCGENYPSLAARFAAKEAVAKALGTGIGDVSWQEIEILRDEKGAPALQLFGKALELSQTLGIEHWSISLSHTREHAVAMAVAQ